MDASESHALARTRRFLIALVFFGTILNYVDRQVLSLLKPTIEASYGWGDAEFAHFAAMSEPIWLCAFEKQLPAPAMQLS
jgi:ACS family hexuronate transporter-like MFS transporter